MSNPLGPIIGPAGGLGGPAGQGTAGPQIFLPPVVNAATPTIENNPIENNPIAQTLGPLLGIDVVAVATNSRVAQLTSSSNTLSEALPGETDAPYITSMESFDSWPLDAMHTKASAMDPGVVSELAQACREIAAIPIGGGLAGLQVVISNRWDGESADAAKAFVDTLALANQQLLTGVRDISLRLEIVSSIAAQVKSSIHDDQAFTGGIPLTTLPMSGSAISASELARENLRRAAATLLDNVYGPNYQNAGTGVPSLPAPRAPAGVDGGGWGHGYGSPNNSTTSTTGTTGGPGSGDPAAPGTGEGDPTATQAANAVPTGATPATGQQAGPGPGSGSPASTTAASAQNSTNPAAYGSAGGSGHAGSSGSGRSTTRRPGDRSNSSGTDSVSGGFAAGPMAGALGGAAAGAATGATAAPAARAVSGRPMGMPMGMPMGGAGRGAGGNDDTEHKTPSYLINMDNGNELIGNIDPVAPPVIGA